MDYQKELSSGRWLAKRGYCYYLYASLEDILADDNNVKDNIMRLNAGVPVFNRQYDGEWLFTTRSYAEIKEADNYLSSLCNAKI